MKRFLTIVFFLGGAVEWVGVLCFFLPELRLIYLPLIPIGGVPAVLAYVLQNQLFLNKS